MQTVKEPDRAACERYLKQFHPELKLGEHIDTGGAGVVYELKGTATPKVVKIIDSRYMADADGCNSADKAKRRKCQAYIAREIALMAQLKQCMHIMPYDESMTIYDPDGIDAGWYVSVTLIIMPRMIPLLEFTAKHRKLTADEIVQLTLDIGEALRVCARYRVIHRDVKPSNLFVFWKDGKLRFMLGDFGACLRLEELGGEPVTMAGTVYYCAPEIQLRERLHYFNSDIYSLGVTVFYLLTGDYPMMDRDPATGITSVAQLDLVVPELRCVVEKMLQQDQHLRYHSAQELLDAVRMLPAIGAKDTGSTPKGILAAKEALCHGKLDEALKYAAMSCKKHEKGSRRLLAYCLYRKLPDDARIMELLDECFNESDSTGILIRGMLLAEKGDMQTAALDIRDAATGEEDCVPAWYYYGRFLYYGDCPGIKQERSKGLRYLQRAAERQFYPALRVLKRIWTENPQLVLPAELERLLYREYSRSDPMESEDIIRFL